MSAQKEINNIERSNFSGIDRGEASIGLVILWTVAGISPARPKIFSWRYSGRWSANVATIDVGQQVRCRNAFVDDVRKYRRLDQSFALSVGTLSTDEALNGEHTGRVVELCAGISADALEGASSLAVAVVLFVMDQYARKLWGQRCALGLLAHSGLDRCRLQYLKFGLVTVDTRADQGVEQVGLIQAQLLAALCKPDVYEQCDLVGRFLVDRLVMRDLLIHGLDAGPSNTCRISGWC